MHAGLDTGSHRNCGGRARWRTPEPGEVRITGGFWYERQETNRTATLAHGYAQLEKAGNFDNLRIAAGMTQGTFRGKSFWDSDIYKWLEAVAYELHRRPDSDLERQSRETIQLVAAAQRDDGYINSYFQAAEPGARWTDLTRGHELHCAGHLIEAGIAFNRFLGDDSLLTIARRFADHIDRYSGRDRHHGLGGHPEIELALVELYRETGERRCLDLAGFFVDSRGKMYITGGLGRNHLLLRQSALLQRRAARHRPETDTADAVALDALLSAQHHAPSLSPGSLRGDPGRGRPADPSVRSRPHGTAACWAAW